METKASFNVADAKSTVALGLAAFRQLKPFGVAAAECGASFLGTQNQ